jgi:general secretion pathway protein F
MKIRPASAPLPSGTAPTPAAGQASAGAKPDAGRVDEERFAHDLSLMMRSGLGLLESLRTLVERSAGRGQQQLTALVGALQRGESLSGAMQAGGRFSAALLACIRASELTGDLADSLQRFAANAARLRVLRARLVSACVYPALLVTVASLVVLFLLVYVVPRFAMVLESASQELPLMSRGLIGLGMAMHAIQGPLLAVVSGALGLLAWMLWRRVRSGEFERLVIDLAVRLPWLRTYARSFGLAQLARSVAMLIRSGVPALKAFKMCRGLLASLDQPRLDMALAAASAGAPLGQSLRDATVIDPLDQRILRVAEQTGQLDSALDRLADLHDASLEQALERIGRVIEPMLMLTIGTVVGGIVVLMYLPIFQLAASIR